MLWGQVRSAVCFITDRIHGGSVMPLDASTGVPGYSVLDILRKTPELLMSQLFYTVMFFLL